MGARVAHRLGRIAITLPRSRTEWGRDQARGLGADRRTLQDWVLKLWDFDKPHRHAGARRSHRHPDRVSLGVASPMRDG